MHGHHSLNRAEETAAAIVAAGGRAQALAHSTSPTRKSTRAALDALLAEGPIHALVNNAGIHDDAPMAGMSDEQWHRVIDVSLHGFFHVTQPLLLPMARARFGRIVSIGSAAAQLGNRGQTNYAAAKAALRRRQQVAGARDGLARDHRQRGRARGDRGAHGRRRVPARTHPRAGPAQRAGKPEEVAALVAFLCSDAAAYINGQVIGVNGGMG